MTLLGMGLVQVYSSSYIYATESFGNGLLFFQKQAFFVLLSFLTMLFFARVNFELLRKWGWTMWLVAAAGVALTLIPGLGVRVGGAHRWLAMPLGFRLEPSEFLKVLLPLFLATLCIRPLTGMARMPLGFLLVSLFAPFALLLLQPDFGSFTLMTFVMMAFLFVFGLKWRYIFAGLATALPAFYFLVMAVPYRRARVMSFLDPWSDPEQAGFQVIQSLLSFSSGGATGVGLGQGQGKLFFLPEAHTDFTLAVLGEETGFVGFFIVMSLYAFLIFRGLRIAARSEDNFIRSLATGLTTLFAMNVFINVGVALGLLPTKGLTLPFMSYGGSSLVAMGILFGLLLNLERQANLSSRHG
ncbi:MAG: putative lipid II flippase FtsW [Bdellovibrionaceae bacterium]|nr:putative lipid II flippase FtsW [Pseudobdellovibrionaceae bacterium]